MDSVPLSVLAGVLVLLFVLSAFFSGSETALMALNRYRLRHLAEQGNLGARRAQALLERPDRLIGLILLGNNLVNILITQLATYIGYLYYQELGVAIATGVLTVTILVFAEVAPKTLAALHAERIAYPAAIVYTPLLVLAGPLVWLINRFANGLLRWAGMPEEESGHALTREELRSAVQASHRLIPRKHKQMLLTILDMERITVEDIMVPRGEIVGIDLSEDWSEVLEILRRSRHSCLPVFEEEMDNVLGFLHMRDLSNRLFEELEPETVRKAIVPPYFIDGGTKVYQQLLEFQKHKRRQGLVVGRHNDIRGLVAQQDILDEIAGSVTSGTGDDAGAYRKDADGSVVVEADMHVRQVNTIYGMDLHTDGPRTLNGLVLEHMEDIPDAGTTMLIDRYPVEVLKADDLAVRTVRIHPRQQKEEG